MQGFLQGVEGDLMDMWGIALAIAVGAIMMAAVIQVSSDLYTYLELQRKLRKERERKGLLLR